MARPHLCHTSLVFIFILCSNDMILSFFLQVWWWLSLSLSHSHSDHIMSNEYINYETINPFFLYSWALKLHCKLSNCNTLLLLLLLPFSFVPVRKMIISQWDLPKSTEWDPPTQPKSAGIHPNLLCAGAIIAIAGGGPALPISTSS